MISPSAIDEVTLWFSAAILSDPAHEIDQRVISRVAEETSRRPLAEVIDQLQDEHREDAGEFGLGQEAFLLASVLLPAVHGLVSAFAAKFFEGPASASGKATVEAPKDRIAKSFAPDVDPIASQAAIADLRWSPFAPPWWLSFNPPLTYCDLRSGSGRAFGVRCWSR